MTDSKDRIVITFSKESTSAWSVEFTRGERISQTGTGDSPRVFATVLAAIQEFVKKQEPNMLVFTAVKSEAYSVPKRSDSRIKLYDRMIQRFAPAQGYQVEKRDLDQTVLYVLKRSDQPVFNKHNSKDHVIAEADDLGDCFVVAGKAMLDNKIPELKLVHAYVTGQGLLKGRRFEHAWNEIGDVVFDNSNGRKIIMRKEQYYELGKVVQQPKQYAVYDRISALKKMAKTKHYGPWDLE